jgi:hypothetical protein
MAVCMRLEAKMEQLNCGKRARSRMAYGGDALEGGELGDRLHIIPLVAQIFKCIARNAGF